MTTPMARAAVVAMCLWLGAGPPRAAGEYIDYEEHPHWMGGCETPGVAYGIAVSGTYAYVTDGLAGFHVVDVTNDERPEIVGSVDTPGTAREVALCGTVAYVADGESGLQVIDVADPLAPEIVGSVAFSEGYDVCVAEGHAYVASGPSGFRVIDVSDPTNPQILATEDTPGFAVSLVTSASYAYVADAGPGLAVIDISDPTDPMIVGAVDLPGSAICVAVSEKLAYVASRLTGAHDADVGVLHVIDVADPAASVLVGSVGTESGAAVDLVVRDGYAYLACPSGVHILDVRSPAAPEVIAAAGTRKAQGIVISGDRAYVADWDAGLGVIDIEPPLPPEILGRGDANWLVDVAVSGRYAYTTSESGLLVYDIESSTPKYVSSLLTPSGGVALSGDHAFLAAGSSGLRAVDISNPEVPQLVGSLDTPGFAHDLDVEQGHAYVTDGAAGLRVIDVSDPTDLVPVSNVVTPGEAWRVLVVPPYAYVTATHSGVLVIDIADPANPEIVGAVDTPGSALGVAGFGHYLCVTDWRGYGLHVIDVQDPVNPGIAGTLDLPQWVNHITIQGRHAYVSGVHIYVVDLANPGQPRCMGSIRLPDGGPEGLFASGDRLYVPAFSTSSGVGGLYVLPLQRGAGTSAPLEVPAGSPRVDAFPNPASHRFTIRFQTRTSGVVQTRIHDAAGRLVSVLQDGTLDRGGHELSWDGRDARGRPVASGVYLLCVATAEGRQTRRLVLVH